MNDMTRLVNIRVKNLRAMGYASLEKWLENPDHVYIGRANHYVKGTFDSPWRNPFSVQRYGRAECIRLYKEYVLKKEDLNVEDLRGKTLGCWCAPDACHGDVLLSMLGTSSC